MINWTEYSIQNPKKGIYDLPIPTDEDECINFIDEIRSCELLLIHSRKRDLTDHEENGAELMRLFHPSDLDEPESRERILREIKLWLFKDHLIRTKLTTQRDYEDDSDELFEFQGTFMEICSNYKRALRRWLENN